MQTTIGHLRKMIKEHVLGPVVPNFVLQSALDKTTNEIKQSLIKYILHFKSTDDVERNNAEQAMNEMLSGFKDDVKEAFETRLSKFLDSI